MEVGSLEPIERIGQIEKTTPGGHAEHAKRPGHSEPFAQCRDHTFSVIHQKHIGVEFDRENNSSPLTRVKSLERYIVGGAGWMYFYPSRNIGDPLSYQNRRLRSASSSRTTEGTITFSNSAGSISILPISSR